MLGILDSFNTRFLSLQEKVESINKEQGLLNNKLDLFIKQDNILIKGIPDDEQYPIGLLARIFLIF